MPHQITLLVHSEHDTLETAENTAIDVTETHILPDTDYYRVESTNETVPLNSSRGQELLDETLTRTRTAQKNILSDLVEQLNTTDDYDKLLEDKDFRHNCWRLGADNSPIFSFYDATNFHAGTPIHSHDTVETIEQHLSMPLYLVSLTLD